MHLSELKAIHVSELIKMGEALEIENVARMRKQEHQRRAVRLLTCSRP